MLPALPSTDLLNQTPEVDAVDILLKNFSRMLPEGPGVYCFYNPSTGEVVYIGSGSGKGGLRRRVHSYRGSSNKHSKLMRSRIKSEGLLLRAWMTVRSGDARKYELDAIEQYQPKLNVLGWIRESEEAEKKEKGAAQKRSYRRAKIEALVFNPNAEKVCRSCKNPKKCLEFRRNNGKALGVESTCRKCESLLRSELKKLGLCNQCRAPLGPNDTKTKCRRHALKWKPKSLNSQV